METTRYIALDPSGDRIGDTYDSREAAAGACQDASREAGDDGEGYKVLRAADDARGDSNIEVGDWVAGGTGEDADYGQVVEVDGELMVAWQGGTRTPLDEHITAYTSQDAAAVAYRAARGQEEA